MALVNEFYQRVKNILHIVQALLIFVAAMITIATFTQSGQSDSRITYFFVLCLICIPFLLYQTTIPTFQKTRRLANPYAHAVIDLLLIILWLAAFIGEIFWAKNGTTSAKDFKSGQPLCHVFNYGSTEKCRLGQVTFVFGIVICILFVLTSLLSTYGLLYYRRNGGLPGTVDVSNNPTTMKGDDLEFTGASPHAYDELHPQQQEMQQQEQEQHAQTGRDFARQRTDSGRGSPQSDQRDEDEVSATLPPRPIYAKAPRSPMMPEFELVNGPSLNPPSMAYRPASATSLPPENHYEYDGYRNESGDYDVSRESSPNAAEVPALRVDTGAGRWNRVGGGRRDGALAFPAGDYGR